MKKHITLIQNTLKDNNLTITATTPPNSEMGDIAIPCFPLAKKLKKSPMEIANLIKLKLETIDFIEKMEFKSGYLNIFLKRKFFMAETINEILNTPNYGSSNTGKGLDLLIEHTSINPNASPHIGRARNAIIGDSIVRLLKFEGYNVEVHYFVNDIGKQIAMLLVGTEENIKEIRFKDLLEIYVKINEEVKNNKELEKKVFNLLYEMENGNKEIISKFRYIVDLCIKGQVEIFNEIGIKYHMFDYESDYLLDNRLQEILDKLNKTGKLIEDESQRLVLDLTEYNLNFVVLTRGDKTSLYPLRDIAYTLDKIKKNKINNYIVLGEDQKTYFQQIKKALQLLGFDAPTPIHYSFVLLKDGKMSTREGKVVLLEDFIKLAVEKARNEIEKRGNTSTDELTKSIAYGSLKYTILKASNEKNVIFDIDKAISFEGDTGAYLQYQYARICSMLRKCEPIDSSNLNLVLKENQEYNLIKELSKFSIIIEKTKEELSPHLICNYLQNLAKMFSKYYNDFKIIGEDEEITKSRIILITCIKVVLSNGLNILGIEPLEKM